MNADEVKALAIELWDAGQTIDHIVTQCRVSPITVAKWILTEKFPNQMQNYKQASVTFNELQREGNTFFNREY